MTATAHSAVFVGLLFSAVGCASGPASLPPPPSVAVNPAPMPRAEKVRVLIDTIPARARYVREATADMTGVTIPPGREDAFGRVRSSDEPLTDEVWLPGCDQPLKISRTKPTIQATIFKRE